MCGIAGKIWRDSSRPAQRRELARMLAVMRHRGPDGEGMHLDGPVGLGHLRLSIIDLQTGAQPMTNEDGTVWIVFNGEIYNFQELREQLLARGHVFTSRTDTEVIIHLYEELGPDCVNPLRGMFAFAIWDAKKQRLFLARDRVGIKPLYYCQTSEAFYFASELKAIITDGQVVREINLRAVRKFFSFHFVPGEDTLFKNILKLLPGHYLIVEKGKVTRRKYWDLHFSRERWSLSFDDAAEELHDLLRDTVKSHMIADVPVGILLSGGVDSSAIVSFAVQQTDKPVQTFTIGFSDHGVVDERPYARLTAKHFGTRHHETTMSANDFWDFLPGYVRHMEEPVCEPPAVALYYVSKLARDHVKVLLSGEGGDEAFGGYPNYPNMMALQSLGRVLGPSAHPFGTLAKWGGYLIGDGRLQRYGNALGRPLASHYFSRTSCPTDYFNRFAGRILSKDLLDDDADGLPSGYVGSLIDEVNQEALLNQMLYVDTKTWLPDDLLVKADKMTMATSLELRVPLLDHIVLEFAASLPPKFKVHKRSTKRILKSAFAKVLPEEVLNRKKAGFPVPYERWLHEQLRSNVKEVLLSDRAGQRGYFCPREMERLTSVNARSGQYSKELFCLLTLEMWHREFVDGLDNELGRQTFERIGCGTF